MEDSLDKAVDMVYNENIRSSGAVYGAWNDQNDPYYAERDRHAEMYYEQVRNRDTKVEVERIANNTGFRQSDILKIYQHIFVNEYQLEGGIKRFDPNYDMAESWRRLSENGGENIQEHDIIMLRHELMEYGLMKNGFSYNEAHELTNETYNYQAAWISWINKKGDS